MRKAAIINLISRYSVVIIQLFINFILARLISPQEFGIVVIITVFTNFFTIFSDLGIGAAIIQYKNLDQDDYNSIFSFMFYLGLLLGAAFIIVGVIISDLYDNTVYVSLSSILAISIFFNTMNVVPNSIMLKEQRFFEIGIRTFSTAFISGVITIFLAFLHFSYYAVTINAVLLAVSVYCWNRIRVPIKLNFRFSRRPLIEVFGFSIYQLLFSVINYFSNNTDTLLIGKFMGEKNVGLYDKAYRLMSYPMTMFAGIVTPILHPILSNYQNDKQLLYHYLIKIFRVLLYFSIFVSCVCYFAPREIIRILYGKNWDLAIKSFQILSLSIVTKICTSITGSFFQSLNKTEKLFKTGLASTILIVGFTIIGVFIGNIESVSIFVSIAHLLNFWLTYYLLIKEGFEMKYIVFFKLAIRPYTIYIFILIVLTFIPLKVANVFVSLLLKVTIVTIIYIIFLVLFKEWKNLKDAYKMIWGNRNL